MQGKASALVQVHVIQPAGIYFPDDVRKLMKWKGTTLRREVRSGRLRIARGAGRYYVLGAWLLAWIEASEMRQRQRPTAMATDRNGSTAGV